MTKKCHSRPLSVVSRLFRKAHLVMRQLKITSASAVLSEEVTSMSNSLFVFPVVLFMAVVGGVWGQGEAY